MSKSYTVDILHFAAKFEGNVNCFFCFVFNVAPIYFFIFLHLLIIVLLNSNPLNFIITKKHFGYFVTSAIKIKFDILFDISIEDRDDNSSFWGRKCYIHLHNHKN